MECVMESVMEWNDRSTVECEYSVDSRTESFLEY